MNIDTIVSTFRLHGDNKQRKLIARLKKDGEKYVPMLQAIYKGKYSPSIQRWAIEAMGSFSSDLVLKTLRSALKNPYMSVRLHAMIGIYHLNNPKNIRYIKPLLYDESSGIRINALEIIAQYKPRWLRAELLRLSKDEKSYIRNKAKRLLVL